MLIAFIASFTSLKTGGSVKTSLLHTGFNLICESHCHKTQWKPAGSHSGQEQGKITDPKDPKHLGVLWRASIAALLMSSQVRLPGCNAAPHLRLAQHCCSTAGSLTQGRRQRIHSIFMLKSNHSMTEGLL